MSEHVRSGRAALGLALASLGFVALVTALVFALSRERGTATGAGGDAALLAELQAQRELQQRTLEALERLAEELTLARVEPAGAGRTTAGELPAPQVEELLRGLDELRRSFEEQTTRTLEQIASAPVFQDEPLSQVRARRSTVDWPALEELHARWLEDQQATDSSQYFLSARELLEVYGPPSDIFRPSRGGLLFHYRRAPPDIEAPAWYFRVQDGFVVEFFVEVNRNDG